jgi:hypothetical protein
MAPPDDGYRRMVIRDEDEISRHAAEQSIIRMEKEFDRLNEQMSEVLRRMPTDEEMREVRQLLANRRAYTAATAALKNAALWIVAIAAAFTVLQGGFVAAVKAAFGIGK